MPQMMPMNWLILNLFTLLILMILMIILNSLMMDNINECSNIYNKNNNFYNWMW